MFFSFDNDNDNEREFVQRVVINKSRTRKTLWCRRCCANRTVFKCRRLKYYYLCEFFPQQLQVGGFTTH